MYLRYSQKLSVWVLGRVIYVSACLEYLVIINHTTVDAKIDTISGKYTKCPMDFNLALEQ